MSLESYPPELRHSDDGSGTNEAYLHWPDLHLSSFDDVESPTLDPTLLGHSYSRAMEVHARRLLWGHFLLTPSIFKAPPDFRKLSHFPAMGEVGLLCMGTFKPLWGTFHPDGTDWIPLSRYNLPMLNVEIIPPREFLPSEMPAGARSRGPPEIEARLPGRGKHGKDLYARLELGQSENPGPLVFKQRSLHTAMFVCASYEKWQEVAPRVREDYGLKHLAGPMEYVMFTGGFSAERWKTLVSDEMQPDAAHGSEKTLAQNGLTKRIVSVGETDKNVERAWVSIRFYKCLSRKVYKERGKLDQEQRSVVDDVLEYLLDLNPAFDMAVTGHDDIDCFMAMAAELPEYAGLITPNTTYTEFGSLLGTAIRLPIACCTQRIPRYNPNAMRKLPHWLTDFLAKKQTVCFLPYVHDAELWGQLP